ncbi:MAG: MarR family transcriptional regulator [Frankia sp.]
MPPSPPLPFDPIEEARHHWRARGWVEAADGMAAVTSIMRAQQIVQARVDAELRPLSLTFARYELLMLLSFSRHGALPMTKIGSRLQVHPTSVTNAVDRLEAARLVRRRTHPTDRRTTLVELTPDGAAAAESATERLNQRVFATPGLSEGDVTSLIEVLTDMRRTAGDFDDAAHPAHT